MSQPRPTIRFRLDPRSGLAPYRQLIEQIKSAVLNGTLREGDQLPPVREVVAQIAINPNTVQRAYRELEHLGVTTVQWGQGSFVSARALNILSSQNTLLTEALYRFVDAAVSSGVSVDESVQLVRDAMEHEDAR